MRNDTVGKSYDAPKLKEKIEETKQMPKKLVTEPGVLNTQE